MKKTTAFQHLKNLVRVHVLKRFQCPACHVWIPFAPKGTEVCCPDCHTEFEAP